HSCHVVCPALGSESRTIRNGVSIFSVPGLARRLEVLTNEIRSFQPDFVLVSSEDLSHMLLREAARAAPGGLIYLAHTPQFFPFGPASWNPDPKAAAIVRDARCVVAIGHHMREYIRTHLGRDATVIHPPIYGEP